MAEYTLKYINYRAECDAEAFVNDCEEHYHRQLHLVADQIAANCKRKPVVLLNGPSSSGKTTTNDRLGRILEQADLAPLSAILDRVSPIDYKPYMPEDSVLHEFIG